MSSSFVPFSLDISTKTLTSSPYSWILYIILFVSWLSTTNSCQSNIGGTCVGGTSYNGDYSSYVNRIETCRDDLNKDWCVIVYKQNINSADFHCFNYYNTFPVLGQKTCGNGPFDINSGGCERTQAADGTACIVCCCRGNLCNNQYTFQKELQQQFAFTGDSSVSYPSTAAILTSCVIPLVLRTFFYR